MLSKQVKQVQASRHSKFQRLQQASSNGQQSSKASHEVLSYCRLTLIYLPCILQYYSPEDKSLMALAALEAYASAGRHQRAVQLWQSFWRLRESVNGPAAS